MTAIKSVLVFLPPLALGLIAVWNFWPAQWRRAWPLMLSLSIPTGLGLSSLLYFAWCLLLKPDRPGFLILELVLIAAGIVYSYFGYTKSNSISLPITKNTPTKLSWVLTALLILLAAAAGAYFLFYTRYSPNGSFDAYAFWNLKARFIFRDPTNWQAAFSPMLSWEFHPDYPILLPLNTAMAWFQVGKETPYVPAVQAALFTLAGAGLLWSALHALRGWSQAALAGIALLSTPLFALVGVWQLADVPLGTLILATCILLSLHFLAPDEKRGLLILTGFTAGLTAWTKNEGILFLLLTSLLLLVFNLRSRNGRKAGWKDMLAYGSGLLPPLIALLIFKLALAPANDLVGARPFSELAALLFDPQRWMTTLKLMAAEAGRFGHSFFTVWLLPLAWLLLAGRRTLDNNQRQVLRFWIPVFILLLAGYFASYLISPHPLDWHITHSVERLYLHLYPSLLWLVFLVSRTPEEGRY